MFKSLVILAVVVAGTLAANLDSQWLAFKSKHSKLYRSPAEDAYRRGVWESHVAYIESHNAAYQRGDISFYLGENQFADMTNTEFRELMNGYRMRTDHGSGRVYTENDVTSIPDEVDWTTKGYVTPIKNQEQCGSCWAFSATGSLEGQTFRKYGKLVSLSEQNLVDCSSKQGNHGCEGGLMDNAFKYIKENGGIDTEASYPYEARDGTCRFKAANVGANCTGFVDVKSQDESALQNAVATVGPISVAIDANHLTFQLYEGGVYHNFLCSRTNLDHGVLAVGYGVHDNKQYWLVKNSWGESWGIKGYIMMSRNRSNNCGIASQASYPTV